MSNRICGYCTSWKCDNLLHLSGHCIIDQMKRFHGSMCDTCTNYQSKWEYTRPLTKEEQEVENDCSKT